MKHIIDSRGILTPINSGSPASMGSGSPALIFRKWKIAGQIPGLYWSALVFAPKNYPVCVNF